MNFYCTAGRGTELFVVDELNRSFKGDFQVSEKRDGKVFFCLPETVPNFQQELLNLKTVERVFVQILSETIHSHDKRALLTQLHTSIGNKEAWQSCVSLLKHFSHSKTRHQTSEAEDNVKTTRQATRVLDSGPGLDNCKESHEIIAPEYPDAVADTKQVENELSTQNCGESIAKPDESIAKPDAVADSKQVENILATQNGGKRQTKPDAVADSKQVTSLASKPPWPTNKREGWYREKGCKRQKLGDAHDSQITFRVSCKLAGTPKRKLNAQKTSMQMAVLISKLLGWKTDTRHPSYEISIHMNDTALVVGVPLTAEPLSKRCYIRHCGLRSTIAWIMVMLLDVQPGQVVLDPMCGAGTLLLEGAQHCKDSCFIGMDINPDQLKLAQENLHFTTSRLSRSSNIYLVQGDTTRMPLQDNSVDKIFTDAPFGLNHTVNCDLDQFYTDMLLETSRVLRPNGLMILLTAKHLVNNVVKHCSIPEVSEYTSDSTVSSDCILSKVTSDSIVSECTSIEGSNISCIKNDKISSMLASDEHSFTSETKMSETSNKFGGTNSTEVSASKSAPDKCTTNNYARLPSLLDSENYNSSCSANATSSNPDAEKGFVPKEARPIVTTSKHFVEQQNAKVEYSEQSFSARGSVKCCNLLRITSEDTRLLDTINNDLNKDAEATLGECESRSRKETRLLDTINNDMNKDDEATVGECAIRSVRELGHKMFHLCATHDVKLGETEGVICVLKKL